MPLIRRPGPSGPPEGAKAAPREQSDALAKLGQGNEDERWSAARALADQPGSVAALGEALLHESSHRVREAILTSLARIGTAQSVEAVLPHLRSDDAQQRTAALDALRAMPRSIETHLQRLLADADADVRLLACELARGLPGAEASRLLCDLLEAEAEVNVCASAVEVLAEVGGPEALPVLERCAKRFASTPFLSFSISIATDRIRTESTRGRA